MMQNRWSASLKLRLGLGAALLGGVTILTVAILYLGLNTVAERLDKALESEMRMARYSSLSTQAASFLIVATEAVQTGLPAETRQERVMPIADQMRRTFESLQADVKAAVETAEALGIDEQSRYGTQSLGLARMQALLEQTYLGIGADTANRARLRGQIDSFASNFEPLLGQAVNTEVMFRNQILQGIEALRQRLTLTALGIAGITLMAVACFYTLLVRPQFRRLDGLRAAAGRIGQEDFAINLPIVQRDEIGKLAEETNRMAAALSARRDHVQAREAQLEATIAERTDALQKANRSLAQIDEDRRRFFADISHELRTPLTVILMEAQIGQTASPEAASAFATIATRAERLNRRIDDLLRLARSETGQLALDLQPIEFGSLNAAIVDEIRAEVDNAGLTLTVGDIPQAKVIGDPNWLRQVIVSLVRNAIRHARDGACLHIDAFCFDGLAGVAVIDNGPGIPAADQEHVFDRFAQGSVATAGQGFGVGLALAKWVIAEHGGQIALTSPVPRTEALGTAPGTKIAVCLPLAKA